jgi:hypothetical protein
MKQIIDFTGRKRPLAAVVVLVALLAVGCATPAVRQQRLVAKPNMTFSDSAVFNYNSSRLLPQLASGFASSAGSQNSGCTSCR